MTIMSEALQGISKHIFATEAHGRKDENKIVMATESTEEHEKIKAIKNQTKVAILSQSLQKYLL